MWQYLIPKELNSYFLTNGHLLRRVGPIMPTLSHKGSGSLPGASILYRGIQVSVNAQQVAHNHPSRSERVNKPDTKNT